MTWQEINNKRLPFVRMGERLFRGMYGVIRGEYAKVLKGFNTPEEVLQAALGFRFDDNIVYNDYEKFYVRTSVAFAKDTVKSVRGRLELKQEDDWINEVLEYVRANVGSKITEVIRTHYKDIESIARAAVKEGIEQGWGMEKIAKRIVADQADMDLWKALRIARTETVRASNEGVMIGASELPGNKEKIWISTFDQRTREDHMAADGQRVGYHDKFNVGGELLEFPGDPNGSPENTINCRCGFEILIKAEY
jgi:uncharacterized protein with gpF-like domain